MQTLRFPRNAFRSPCVHMTWLNSYRTQKRVAVRVLTGLFVFTFAAEAEVPTTRTSTANRPITSDFDNEASLL